MRNNTMRTITWAVALLLGAALLVAGPVSASSPQAKTKQKQKQAPAQPDQGNQQPADQQPADQPGDQPPPPAPKSVLTQKVTLRSSHQTKDVASAGFNGVGPDGKIKEALLSASPSAAAKQKAAQLSLLEADAAEVQTFAKEGKLNLPAKSADKKGK